MLASLRSGLHFISSAGLGTAQKNRPLVSLCHLCHPTGSYHIFRAEEQKGFRYDYTTYQKIITTYVSFLGNSIFFNAIDRLYSYNSTLCISEQAN